MMNMLNELFDKFIELHGDRVHGETKQVCCGLGWIEKQKFISILHNHCDVNNLSIGYRKSLRMLKLAEQLEKPVLWCVQNIEISVSSLSLDLLNNINKNITTVMDLKVPIIGVFYPSAIKSAMVNMNIVDYAILLANNEIIPDSIDMEIINPNELSVLRSHLIKKVSEISRVSSSDLINERIKRINL